MTSNVKMILDEVNARIKLAEAKTAEDPSNFDAFPGAENDAPVNEEAKKPDPEVKDEGPASRTEVDGAEPGSDVPVQQDHLYEADEPVLTPEKKPEDTADANAKTASARSANKDVEKVAMDIMSIIRDSMNKKAGCGGCSGNSCKKPATKGEKKEEKKAADMINLGNNILDKIAAIRMAKEAGANDAIELMKVASEYNRGAEDAQNLIEKLAQALEESANSADMAEEGVAEPDMTPAEAGAADAEAALADAAAMDEANCAADGTCEEDPVTPEEVAEAIGELVDEGQISEEDAASLVEQIGAETITEGGEPEVTDEQIAEGIIQAVESGEITEDEAQQIVEELVADGADPSVQEEVAEAAPEEIAAAEEAGAEDALKTAEYMSKSAEDQQIAQYQNGFIQKCAEYGADPRRVAQYIQARVSGQL